VVAFEELLDGWDGETAVVSLEQLGWSAPELDLALARIGTTLREVYDRADTDGGSTADAAEVLVQDRLRSA
jgi:hypothetical protein